MERHSKSYIHSIFGSTDTFLFDRVDKIILSLDLHGSSTSATGAAGGGTFTYASKLEMMSVLRCNEDEFLDMGLLLGFEYCPTFPPLTDGTIPNPYHGPSAPGINGSNGAAGSATNVPNPRQALDTVRQYRSGFTACTAHAEHATCAKLGYVDAFCRARCMIKFCLVTSAEEGRILPLSLSTLQSMAPHRLLYHRQQAHPFSQPATYQWTCTKSSATDCLMKSFFIYRGVY
jgi:hypothetical protein